MNNTYKKMALAITLTLVASANTLLARQVFVQNTADFCITIRGQEDKQIVLPANMPEAYKINIRDTDQYQTVTHSNSAGKYFVHDLEEGKINSARSLIFTPAEHDNDVYLQRDNNQKELLPSRKLCITNTLDEEIVVYREKKPNKKNPKKIQWYKKSYELAPSKSEAISLRNAYLVLITVFGGTEDEARVIPVKAQEAARHNSLHIIKNSSGKLLLVNDENVTVARETEFSLIDENF